MTQDRKPSNTCSNTLSSTNADMPASVDAAYLSSTVDSLLRELALKLGGMDKVEAATREFYGCTLRELLADPLTQPKPIQHKPKRARHVPLSDVPVEDTDLGLVELDNPLVKALLEATREATNLKSLE